MQTTNRQLLNRSTESNSYQARANYRSLTARTLRLAAASAAILAGAVYARADWVLLDHPGAVATFPWSVSGNKVVGIYYPTTVESHGFVYDGTTWTDLDYPGALYPQATGVSGKKIVGRCFSDPAAQFWHGFV